MGRLGEILGAILEVSAEIAKVYNKPTKDSIAQSIVDDMKYKNIFEEDNILAELQAKEVILEYLNKYVIIKDDETIE